MRFLFPSPYGPPPCPVDDAPHTTCTSADYSGTIVIPQLPARDALAVVETKPVMPRLRAEEIQTTLPPGAFTTGTYRGKKKGIRP